MLKIRLKVSYFFLSIDTAECLLHQDYLNRTSKDLKFSLIRKKYFEFLPDFVFNKIIISLQKKYMMVVTP